MRQSQTLFVRSPVFWLACLCVLVGLYPTPAAPQNYDLEVTPSFYLDLNYFKVTDRDSFDVELYLKVPVNLFIFTNQDTAFLATYRFSYLVFDTDDRQVTGAETLDSLWLRDYAATHALDRYQFMRAGFRLAPGSYEVKVILTDLNNTQPRVYTKSLELPQITPGSELLSDIRFLDPSWSRHWDSLRTSPRVNVLPQVSNRYLLGDDDTLVFLYETYGLQGAPLQYKVRTSLLNRVRKRVVTVEETLTPGPSPHYGRIPLTEVDAGHSYLQVELLRNDLKVASREKEVYLVWSRLGLVRRDWETALEELRYVGTTSDLNKLKELPDSLRMTGFELFWKAKDPTPSTPVNELEEEYYRRVEYANEKYSGIRPGFETDPGGVYITYGEPDEIENHPYDMSSKSYQIWFYYSQNVKFIFVDRFGDGELSLSRKERI